MEEEFDLGRVQGYAGWTMDTEKERYGTGDDYKLLEKVTGYSNGEGEEPELYVNQYVKIGGGFTTDKDLAEDFRGEKGETGNNGYSLFSGSGVPSGGLGSNGDTYVNTTSGDTYFKSVGTWDVNGSVRGPIGPIGLSTTNMTVAGTILGLNTGDTVPSSPKQLTPVGLTLQGDKVYNAIEQGSSTSKTVQCAFPSGGMYNGALSETGAIKICNPNLGVTTSMVLIKGSVYFYDAASAVNRTCDFIITFYPFSMLNGFGAVFLGANAPKFTVRWFTDGVLPYVTIADLTQTWSYSRVCINYVKSSYVGSTIPSISTGWQISLITAFTGTESIIKTETLPRPGLHYAIEEYNAASGVNTPITSAMTLVQVIQNLQKQLDNTVHLANAETVNGLKTFRNVIKSGLQTNSNSGTMLLKDTYLTGSILGVGVARSTGYPFLARGLEQIEGATGFISTISANTSRSFFAIGLGELLYFESASQVIPIGDPITDLISYKVWTSKDFVLATLAAFTATKLLTARTINGVSFDGSANITVADATKIPTSEKGANSGVATLDSGGKIPSSQLPALAITDTFPVASQAAMLALTAQVGDVAIRSDISKTFILRVEPATTLGNWSEVLSPTAAVSSVAGKTGVVTLVKADVGLGNLDNTSDADKPVSTAQAAADALKANIETTAVSGSTTAIQFDIERTYGTNAAPITGASITTNSTGVKIGVTAKLFIQRSTAPTFPATWKLTSGSATWSASKVNRVYAQYEDASNIYYVITND